MGAAIEVIYAVAKELAEQAKNSLPKLRDGETIKREWYSDGTYHRETIYDGKTTAAEYDFRSRRAA